MGTVSTAESGSLKSKKNDIFAGCADLSLAFQGSCGYTLQSSVETSRALAGRSRTREAVDGSACWAV